MESGLPTQVAIIATDYTLEILSSNLEEPTSITLI